jgi:multidrug efflux pump subunit AcrA (membrane-fusion protein)
MSKESRPSTNAAQRFMERSSERFSARPMSVIVFAATLLLFSYLETRESGRFRVRAVAQASTVAHPALAETFVETVHVRPGDTVEPGAPLVELSSYFIDRAIHEVELEIEELRRKTKLEQARLSVEEQRWLPEDVRTRPNRPSLGTPTSEYFESKRQALQQRLSALEEDRGRLTITSRSGGRVGWVVPQGSSVSVGTTVATVSLDYSDEIVAYVPAETLPSSIEPGALVSVVDPAAGCSLPGRVLRRGASVQEAPGQLLEWFRYPVHGMPVYISVPSGCHLADGQLVAVEFARESI